MTYNLQDIVTMSSLTILLIHFYLTNIKKYRNRDNRCARCGIDFSGIEKFSFAASYRKFFYCKNCLEHINKTDKYFFIIAGGFVTIICMFILILA